MLAAKVVTYSPRPQAVDTAATADTVYCPPPLHGELWGLSAVYWIPEVAATAHATNYASFEAFGSDGVECANLDLDTPTTDDLTAGVPAALAFTKGGTALQYQPASLGVKCTVSKEGTGLVVGGVFACVWEALRDVD